MHIAQTRLSIATEPREIKEITAEVARWTERQRISVGLLTLYIPHTSAPLLIQENASPDVRRDLDAFLPRIGEPLISANRRFGMSWFGTSRRRRLAARYRTLPVRL